MHLAPSPPSSVLSSFSYLSVFLQRRFTRLSKLQTVCQRCYLRVDDGCCRAHIHQACGIPTTSWGR